MKPLIPPIDATGNVFVDGDPNIQGDGTAVPSLWLNNMQDATRSTQSELLSVLAAGGQSADTAKNNQLLDAIKTLLRKTVRLGEVQWLQAARTKIPAGFVAMDGQTLIRASYSDMWNEVSSLNLITTDETQWLSNPILRGSYTKGDNTTTFRIPDLNGKSGGSIAGVLLRGDGTALGQGGTAIGHVNASHAPNIKGGFKMRGYNGGDTLVFPTTPTAPFSQEQVNAPTAFNEIGSGGGNATNTYTQVSFNANSNSTVYSDAIWEVAPNAAVGVWIVRVLYPY